MRVADIRGPDESGRADGLAYALYRPDAAPLGGVVVLHGAGSRKESHLDFARRCAAHGIAAVSFDLRGHGESEGDLDARAVADVVTAASVLPPGPVGLRGSSLGGYLALVAAEAVEATAVVAICPATAEGLARGLAQGRFDLRADVPSLDALLAEHPADEAAARLRCPLLLLHAEGDESVPIAHSRLLHERAAGSRLVEVPGGHHRSIQHDDDLQALSVRFLQRAFGDASGAA